MAASPACLEVAMQYDHYLITVLSFTRRLWAALSLCTIVAHTLSAPLD